MADIYSAIAQSIKNEIFYHFKSAFYERARCPFHKKFILCGTGILPVLENGTTSQLT
ncbi:hypothetical protein [Microcoleus sp. AT9b-C2]|uniref:hypothetical protein n=1 Tax=Microcoleus sp. AT9b-C2 TaxID=2818628 RepID=UPI002FD11995